MNVNTCGRITAGSLLVLLTVIVLPPVVQATEYPFSIGQGFEFSSGKYGTNTRTDAIYAPFSIMITPVDRLGLSLEIPYVYQSNGNVVSSVARGGMPTTKTTMLPTGGTGNMSGSGMSSSSAASNQSESGLGDITFRLGYVLVPEKESMPQIRPTVFIKFPTADKNKSLGTGEFDEGFAVEISKWLGNWNPFVEAGYTVQGKSPDLSLKNYMNYNAGAGYQVTERFRPMLLVKGSTSTADGVSDLLEVRLKLKYQATNNTGIEGYIARGITTGSPDFGSGLAVYYDF